MAKFCVGLPLTGIRPLTIEEMEIIRGEASRYRGLTWTIWLLMPIAMFTWMGALAAADDKVAVGTFLAMIVGLVVFALAVAFARERGQCGKQLRRDLVQGSILVFEGVPTFEFGDRAQSVLIGKGYFRFGAGHETDAEPPPSANSNGNIGCRTHEVRDTADRHVVEVLESSNRIFRVDGLRLPGWLMANVIEIGSPEPSSPDFPRLFVPIEMRMRQEVRRRALSESEKKELNRLWGRTVLGLSILAGLTIYLAVLGLGFIGSSRHPDPSFRILGYAVGLFDIFMLKNLPWILRCRSDAQNGIVLVLDVSNTSEFGESEITARANRRIDVEALPLSGRVWTVEGYPADWRRAAARKANR
ncbi:MAG TPA: hypothetical protein VHE55_05435 [Fimbriimonadaceae bacterium]|nr:hypothetical protein [Fimbriimonadaceae bacterium]